MRDIEDKVDSLIEGSWSVTDIIEMIYDEMDETSTTGSVGSGTDRPLGTRDPDEKLSDDERVKKIMMSYKEARKVYEGTDQQCWYKLVQENSSLSVGLVSQVRLALISEGYSI